MAATEWEKYKEASERYYYLNTQGFTTATCAIENKLLEDTFDMVEKTISGKRDKVRMVNNYVNHRLIYTPDASLQIFPPQLFFELLAKKEGSSSTDKKLVEIMNKNADLLIKTTTQVMKDAFSFLTYPNKSEIENLNVTLGTHGDFVSHYQYRGNIITEEVKSHKKYITVEDMSSKAVLHHEVEFSEDKKTNKLYPKIIITTYGVSGQMPEVVTQIDYQPVYLGKMIRFPSKVFNGFKGKEFMMSFSFINCFGI